MSQRAIKNFLVGQFNKVDVFDYQRSVKKKTNFDVVDVMMHICRGFMENSANDRVYFLSSCFDHAAEIYFKFGIKEITVDHAINLAAQQGRAMYYKLKTTGEAV